VIRKKTKPTRPVNTTIVPRIPKKVPVPDDALRTKAAAIRERQRLIFNSPPHQVEIPTTWDDPFEGVGTLTRPRVRHLLYHVYPRRNSTWRSRILRLRESLPLFNGRRRVAIVYDGTTEHPGMVKDALHDCHCEYIELKNEPERREVWTFRELFEPLAKHTGPDECTLYGHAKGVTRPKEGVCQLWARTLEDLSFDYWPLVERLLTRYSCAGPFRHLGRGWAVDESRSVWHYSGSWFWFRNDQIFNRPDWREIDQFWSGIESWLSNKLAPREAGILFGSGHFTSLNLYEEQAWTTVIMNALDDWKRRHPRTPAAEAR
jgi:hypothetical protein